jgi:hypothetical protein
MERHAEEPVLPEEILDGFLHSGIDTLEKARAIILTPPAQYAAQSTGAQVIYGKPLRGWSHHQPGIRDLPVRSQCTLCLCTRI